MDLVTLWHMKTFFNFRFQILVLYSYIIDLWDPNFLPYNQALYQLNYMIIIQTKLVIVSTLDIW